MTNENDEDRLVQLVRQNLPPHSSPIEIRSRVTQLAARLYLGPDTVERVVQTLSRDLQVPPNLPAHPRLLVDWGELPRVGYQCRPEFVLLCPTFPGRPDVHVQIDRELDAQTDESRVNLSSDGPGFWTFHLPFRMTTQGCDCRPGQYLLEVTVTFHDVPADSPRFFQARIRLNVAGNQEGGAGILEIDGDGQSVVNLQGYDLRQFSKVVLKGGQDGVINLANSSFATPASPEPSTPKPPTSFEYALKIDQQRQQHLPKLWGLERPRAYLESMGLYFEDGRRVLLLTRARLSFGRSRDNDVVLRFFPRSTENDGHSLIISRTHFTSELVAEGIELADKSRSGLEVNVNIVKDRYTVPLAFVGESVQLDLGVTATVPKQFELEMSLLGPDRRQSRQDLEYWEELLCEIVGGKLSRLARLAINTGVDAVRYDRCRSLAGQETYVHLFREVLVGSSSARCGIVLSDCGPQPIACVRYIDRTFWLQPLEQRTSLTVDDSVLPPNCLVPLAPGMRIGFGSEFATIDRVRQMFLE